jgi:hypothetical protein
MAMVVVGWLLACGLRRRYAPRDGWARFDGLQLLLAGWTLAALGVLYAAVRQGLLGAPAMQVFGNGSQLPLLRWTQDRTVDLLPRPLVLAAPLWFYRVLMLLWSLWLAWRLLGWLRWCWDSYRRQGLWRRVPAPRWPWRRAAKSVQG